MRLILLSVLLAVPVLRGERETILRKPAAQPQVTDLKEARKARLEIAAAMLELKDLHPDFEVYAAKILELSDAFLPGKTVSARNYLEGLYFIAKHTGSQVEDSDSGSGEAPEKSR